MSRPQGLGFGGFLVGLGTGWVLFDWMNVTRNLFAWALIIIGSGVVASGFISRWSQARHLGGIVRGLAGGLVLSLVVTSGMGFAGPVIGVGSLGSYRASETRVLDGSMADDRVLVDVQVFNGGVDVSTWDREEYQLSVYVRAKGTSDADAQRNLDDLELDFSESTVMGRRTLVLRHNVAPTKTSLYSVSVEVRLPAGAVVDLDLASSNGGFQIAEVDGGDLNLKTSNGGVTFQGVTADTVNVDTSNGGVQGSLDASDVWVDTSNGRIGLRLPCTKSGTWVLDTSNGAITLDVSSSTDVGYDVELSTSNGAIDVGLPEMVYSLNRNTRKDARTDDYPLKGVQVAIEAHTSNGSIDIEA